MTVYQQEPLGNEDITSNGEDGNGYDIERSYLFKIL